ncbi:hypothetical protein J8273_7172 [Carpediemonas membranifera]|uniref:Uncharacterized protein n=1 Tax=Carpediemonas membranifera TaxID=201153 RepID=A0A8J6E1P7_9EUKA|nr:hypothetical protein J8273_7172 [Carpediemonas membranifera]|eukprot:KAG9390907.1 hypothetical protein J8273_7172 [Carpediemonas membranifera]
MRNLVRSRTTVQCFDGTIGGIQDKDLSIRHVAVSEIDNEAVCTTSSGYLHIEPFYSCEHRTFRPIISPLPLSNAVFHQGLSSFLTLDDSITFHRLDDASFKPWLNLSDELTAHFASEGLPIQATVKALAVAPDTESIAAVVSLQHSRGDTSVCPVALLVFRQSGEGLFFDKPAWCAVGHNGKSLFEPSVQISAAFSPDSRMVAIALDDLVLNIEVASDPDPLAMPSETTLPFKTKTRQVRVRHGASAPLPRGQQTTVSWSPSGRYIAAPMATSAITSAVHDADDSLSRLQDKTLPPPDMPDPTHPEGDLGIGLLERHLVAHARIPLQKQGTMDQIRAVRWIDDGLAIVHFSGFETDFIHIYTKTNTIWLLKHVMPVPANGTIHTDGRSKIAHISPTAMLQFTVTPSPTIVPSPTRAALVIDGPTLKVTMLTRAIIPPPFCAFAVEVGGPIQMACGMPQSGAEIGSDHVGLVYLDTNTQIYHIAEVTVTPTGGDIARTYTLGPSLPVGLTATSHGFLVLTLARDRHHLTHFVNGQAVEYAVPNAFHLATKGMVDELRAFTPVAHGSTHALAVFGNGIYQYSVPSGWSPLSDATAVVPADMTNVHVTQLDVLTFIVTAVSTVHIWTPSTSLDSALTLDRVSSSCLSEDGLALFVIQDKTLAMVDIQTKSIKWSRQIERSCHLVTTLSDAIIVQHSRGNLETVYVALLIQTRAAAMARDGRLALAASTLRRHRLSMAALLDGANATGAQLVAALPTDHLVRLAADVAGHARGLAVLEDLQEAALAAGKNPVAIECALQLGNTVLAVDLATDVAKLARRIDPVEAYRACIRVERLDLAVRVAEAAAWDAGQYGPAIDELRNLKESKSAVYDARMKMIVGDWNDAVDAWIAVPWDDQYISMIEESLLKSTRVFSGIKSFSGYPELVKRVVDAALARGGLAEAETAALLVLAGLPVEALPYLVRSGQYYDIVGISEIAKVDPTQQLKKCLRILINSGRAVEAAECSRLILLRSYQKTQIPDSAAITDTVNLYLSAGLCHRLSADVVEPFGPVHSARIDLEVIRPLVVTYADSMISNIEKKIAGFDTILSNLISSRRALEENTNPKRVVKLRKTLRAAEDGFERIRVLSRDDGLWLRLVAIGETEIAASLQRARASLEALLSRAD